MRILSLKPGHDGAAAYVEDGCLLFSIEAEKDSNPRYGPVSVSLIDQALQMMPRVPDVFAISGWFKRIDGTARDVGAGYYGLDGLLSEGSEHLGRKTMRFSSSHERSHIFGSVAMAPFAPARECIVLVWEGYIGNFYHWMDFGKRLSVVPGLSQPGARYSALFALADPAAAARKTQIHAENAGRLMALAAFGRGLPCEEPIRRVVEEILSLENMYPFDKARFKDSALYNCGVDTPPAHAAARYMTDRLFEVFESTARRSLPRGLPLVVSGGCGLNCEWNRRWRECGLFSEVFVPPCANDSGSAIGTAVDAMVHYGGACKLEWSVYSGPDFVPDQAPDPGIWRRKRLDASALAQCLARGEVAAWAQGRCEIGPRSLGHRSILASPLAAGSRDLLNRIKGREAYRPIAPCCRHEEIGRWFSPGNEDPYMLYFNDVKGEGLPAVRHVDGTARMQSVRPGSVPRLHQLLTEFSRISGYGVLCNTSLNFKGQGFINRASDLAAFCQAHEIPNMIVEDVWYDRVPPTPLRRFPGP